MKSTSKRVVNDGESSESENDEMTVTDETTISSLRPQDVTQPRNRSRNGPVQIGIFDNIVCMILNLQIIGPNY